MRIVGLASSLAWEGVRSCSGLRFEGDRDEGFDFCAGDRDREMVFSEVDISERRSSYARISSCVRLISVINNKGCGVVRRDKKYVENQFKQKSKE